MPDVNLTAKKATVYDLTVKLEEMKQSFQLQAKPLIAEIQKLEKEIAEEKMKQRKENEKKQAELAVLASKKKQ